MPAIPMRPPAGILRQTLLELAGGPTAIKEKWPSGNPYDRFSGGRHFFWKTLVIIITPYAFPCRKWQEASGVVANIQG